MLQVIYRSYSRRLLAVKSRRRRKSAVSNLRRHFHSIDPGENLLIRDSPALELVELPSVRDARCVSANPRAQGPFRGCRDASIERADGVGVDQALARQVRSVVTACLQRQNPDGAGRVYIEASCCNVSRSFAQACIAPKFRTSQHVPMRPLALNPLFASLRSLTGVGPKLEKLYARLLDRDAPRVVDLLFHMPSGVIDRRARPKLQDVQPGQIVTVSVTVDKHRPSPPHHSRAPYRIYAHDDTGDITSLFQRAQGLPGEAAAGGRDALRVGHRRILRRHVADGASRPRGR
jgi:hypothetical protein